MLGRLAAKRTLVLFGLLASTGCDITAQEATLVVDHYRQPCDWQDPGFCLRVLDSTDVAVSASGETIDINGFDYRAGYIYEVSVLAIDTATGERDFELLEVVSKTPADPKAVFDLHLTASQIERVENREFRLTSDELVYCQDAAICRDIASAIVDGKTFVVALSHDAASSGTFIAHSVQTR